MSDESTSANGERFERTVLPGLPTLVSLEIQPHSVCYLSDAKLGDDRLQLDADEYGVVRFHATASRDGAPLEVLLEEVYEDGTTVTHTIALSADANHWAPPTRVDRDGRQTIPALTDDPQDLSNEDLVRRGYPPRPDPKEAPIRYARWRQIVSQEYVRVNPKQVEHPDVRFTKIEPETVMSPTLPLPPPSEREALEKLLGGVLPVPRQLIDSMFNSSSSTWSGVYVTEPANQFFVVEADWTVPRVFAGPTSPTYSAVAKWVGLGNSSSDLFQSGTDSESFNFMGWQFANYWMWIEPLPYAPWSVPNFLIEPGDRISVSIFVADERGTTWFQEPLGGGLTNRDDTIWFMLYNKTRRLSYWGTYPTVDRGGRFRFNGNTAEFILERPSSSRGGAFALANFCITTMRNCAFADSEYGGRDYFPVEPDDGSQPFDGTETYLNMDNPATGHRLATAVSGQDPTSYGGYDIIWVYSNAI